MKVKEQEQCGQTFDDSVCTLRKQHGGKHIDGRGTDSRWMSWSNEGKIRELAERERRAEIEKEPF